MTSSRLAGITNPLPSDPAVPLTSEDVAKGNGYSALLRDFAVFGRLQALEGSIPAAEDLLDEVLDLEFHTVQQVFVVANTATSVPLVPEGVDGELVWARYDRVTAPTSAAGDIGLRLRDGNSDPVTTNRDIDGGAAGTLSLEDDGTFVDGLNAVITSDNVDATAGVGLRVSVRYKVTRA